MTSIFPQERFREARERLGLTPDEVATLSGIPYADVWEIEVLDADLVCCYSPRQLQQFCRVLKIHPIRLFSDKFTNTPISAEELVQRIRRECRMRGITLEEFENSVGWRLSACISPPEKLLEDITIDSLQRLSREVCIDWRRVLLSL